MLTIVIWCVAVFLEALLLFRGLQIRLVRSFPIFYLYILFVLVEEVLRFAVYRLYPKHYSEVYWVTQFVGLVIGSAIIFEIYRVGLRQFPGTARMTRYLLLVVFGTVFAKALTNSTGDLFLWLAGTSVALERSLRIVQEVAILTLVFLFLLYAIPFGRNLRGIALGYGLFIGMTVAQFTLWFYFPYRLRTFWPYAQPVSYVLVLGLWVSALWFADPVRGTEPAMQLEYDYQSLATSTRSQLQRALSRLRWAVRP